MPVRSRLISVVLTTFTLAACSSTPAAPGNPTTTGGSSPSAGSGGILGAAAGTGSSSGGDTTSAGAPGGGANIGGASPTGGAGAMTGGNAGSGGMAMSGITCAPGTTGNGVHDQPGPYDAPPEATAKAGVPTGTLSALMPIQSTIYAGHVFGYRVYVPAQYKPGKRAAFMMLQDGPTHYLGANGSQAKFFANVVMDNLIAEGSVPVTIGLFVDPCMQACETDRVTIYDDATDKYARFVTEELLPTVIAGKYSIVEDPEAWLTVGYSAGAAQGFTVMWNRPVFHKFIGHNSSFPAAMDHGVDYAALIPQTPNKGFRVSLVSGTMDLSDARGNWLQASEQMEMVLAAQGYPVRLMTGTGGHYPPDQSAMDFPNALRWTWQGCKLADY